MFGFDDYLEEWATKYKPISHNGNSPSGNAVYRMDCLERCVELCKSSSIGKSPACGIATQIEASTASKNNSKYLDRTIRIFFFVRQKGKTVGTEAEKAAVECKEKGYEMAMDFLAYMQNDTDNSDELRGVQYGSALIETSPVLFGNWWVTQLMFTYTERRNHCVDASKYN